MSRSVKVDPPLGTIFYVSPSGNDSDDGSLATPWLTLAHAQTEIQALVSAMADDITVVLRGGTYALTGVLAFTSADDGANGYTVTWQSMPGEIAILSGGTLVDTWTLHDAGLNIWQATVGGGSDFRQLYADGLRVVRAQSPATPLAGATRTGGGFSSTGGAYSGYAIPTDLEFVWRDSYREPRCAVTAVTGTTITLASPCWTNMQSQWTGSAFNPDFVEGAYEILAAEAVPSTFYLDAGADTVYYIPPVGVDPNTQIVYAPTVQDTLVSLTGTSHLKLVGLNLLYTNWVQAHTSDGFCEGADTGHVVSSGGIDGGNFPPGVVFCSGCTGGGIFNCAVAHAGGSGIWFDFGCAGLAIEGCIVEDCSATGIQGAIWGPLQTQSLSSACRVENNVVQNVGVEYHGADGIFVPQGAGMRIRNNRILNCPYIGLFGGYGGAAIIAGIGANEYSYNDIGPCMQVMDDGAAIYVNSEQPDTTIHHNAVHDVEQTSNSAGIYLDDGSRYYRVHDNVGWNLAKYAIHLNDTVGDNVITSTSADNTTIHATSGVLNNRGGAANDSVAAITAVSTSAAQALAAEMEAGLLPQFSYLSGLSAVNSSGTVAPITSDIKMVLNRTTPAGSTQLRQGMTQTQHTLDTFAADNPRSAAGNRSADVLDLITPLTSGSQAPVGYNIHPQGFGTTNGWAHPPKAVEVYQVAASKWSGTFTNQENPYFYANGTTNATHTPIDSNDGTTVSNSPASGNPQTSGMDVRWDTVTLLGATGIITLCMCPDWMTSEFSTSADYSRFQKHPPLSGVATDYTTLNANSAGVPSELLMLAIQTTPTDHAVLADGKRGLYFMDYWRYYVKQIVRRYCVPSSPYLQGTSGTINSGGNTPCTILQIWNEFGGLDFPSHTIGGNNYADRSFPEQVTSGVTTRINEWDHAQYAWLYGHTYAAIEEVMSEEGTSRAALGLQVAGPYLPARWNYYHPTTGAARSTPGVLDTDSTYYNLQHGDQLTIAQWFMYRSGSGNAYPTAASGITQRTGTVPQWTPDPSGDDGGSAQSFPAYDMDLLCFDGLQRRSTDPIGQAVSSLPNMKEPARTAAQWKAQLLADTPRYEVAYADLAQLAANCGKPGVGIVQSENYSDVTLDSGTPVSGSETTTGTNHQYYADHDWVCAQTTSQWLHMAKAGGAWVLRWQPEGVSFLNKNVLPDTVSAGTYFPAWSNDGDQQSLWYDARDWATAGITPRGTAPGQGAFSTTYTPAQPFPLWFALLAFHDHFSVDGTNTPSAYYNPVITDKDGGVLGFEVEAIDSGDHVLIVNKDLAPHSITLIRNGRPTVLADLAAYEVRLVAI